MVRPVHALTIPALVCAVVVCGASCSGGSRGAPPGADQFLAARELVVCGRYEEAVEALKAYQASHPRGAHASRAGLFLGKAYLAMGMTDRAREAFEATVRDFPATLEGHKCRYKLGVVEMIEGNDGEALRRFSELSATPDGPLAAEAEAMRVYLSRRANP